MAAFSGSGSNNSLNYKMPFWSRTRKYATLFSQLPCSSAPEMRTQRSSEMESGRGGVKGGRAQGLTDSGSNCVGAGQQQQSTRSKWEQGREEEGEAVRAREKRALLPHLCTGSICNAPVARPGETPHMWPASHTGTAPARAPFSSTTFQLASNRIYFALCSEK